MAKYFIHRFWFGSLILTIIFSVDAKILSYTVQMNTSVGLKQSRINLAPPRWITHSLMPVIPAGMKGSNKGTPLLSVLGLSFWLVPQVRL